MANFGLFRKLQKSGNELGVIVMPSVLHKAGQRIIEVYFSLISNVLAV